MNTRQGRRLLRRHQGAFRRIGFTDAAGDGGGDPGIAQVDACCLNHRFPILDIGFRLFQGRCRVVVILLADRFVGKQFLEAFGSRSDRRQVSFGLGNSGLGVVQDRLKRSGIDLIENLPGPDVGTFRKQSFLNDAVDLGADFSDQVG